MTRYHNVPRPARATITNTSIRELIITVTKHLHIDQYPFHIHRGPNPPFCCGLYQNSGGHFKPNQEKIKMRKIAGDANGGLNSCYRFVFMTFADISIYNRDSGH